MQDVDFKLFNVSLKYVRCRYNWINDIFVHTGVFRLGVRSLQFSRQNHARVRGVPMADDAITRGGM